MLTALILVAFTFQEPRQPNQAAKDWKKTYLILDAEVSVPWAAWTPVRYKDENGRIATTEGRFLCVVVAFKALPGKTVSYQSWNAPGKDGIPAMCFGDAEILKLQDIKAVGRLESGTIRSSRPLYDVFVFQQNDQKTKSFELILDTRRIGGADALKLEIPVDQIRNAKPNEILDGQWYIEERVLEAAKQKSKAKSKSKHNTMPDYPGKKRN